MYRKILILLKICIEKNIGRIVNLMLIVVMFGGGIIGK